MEDEKKYDRLFAITVSKNYTNELSIMLDNNAKYFNKWYIATQEDDLKTIELIKSKNLPNIEIVYYPLVPDAIEEHHTKTPLSGSDLHFSYPYWLISENRRDISPKVKRTFKLTFDKGAAIRSIQKIHILKENPTEHDLVLLLDSDIVLPSNFQEILNSKTFESNTLYGAKRKDFMFYSEFVEDKNAKIYNSFDLAGYFHLYKYDSTKMCKRAHDAGYVDAEFKRQFSNTFVFDDIVVSHIGISGINWKGKKTESFIYDNTKTELLNYINDNKINCDDYDDPKTCIRNKLSALQVNEEQQFNFPTFIIPGFQKCGSTSLKNNLMQHTAIEFAHGFNSELNYCANEEFFPSNWHHDHMWYLHHFTKDGSVWSDHCNTLFNRGWKTSIDHMRTTYVAKKFAWANDIKFLIMIRNPVDRAFAEYNHFLQEYPASHSYCWEEPGQSFLQNVESEMLAIDELKKRDKHWYDSDTGTNGRLLVNGVYEPVLKHFKQELELNEKTLKVVTLESLVSDPEKTFNEIFEFLEIESQPINLKKYNSFTNREIDPTIKERLNEFYKPYNKKLFEFLGYEEKLWSNDNSPTIKSNSDRIEISTDNHPLAFKDEYVFPILKYCHEELTKNKGKLETLTKKSYNELVKYYHTHFNMSYRSQNLMSEMIKLSDADIPASNNYSKITLITSFYEVKDDERRLELIEAIQNNIDNEHITKVVIYVETKNVKIDELMKDFSLSDKVHMIETTDRLTFAMGIEYASQEADKETVYLLSNSDCYFDSTINLLRKIDFKNGNRVLSFSRKDKLKDGSIIDARVVAPIVDVKTDLVDYALANETDIDVRSNLLMPPYSSDAWAFTYKLGETNVDTDIQLGRLACEQIFLSRLCEGGYDVRNVGYGDHIRCIHIHSSYLRWTDNVKEQDNIHWNHQLPYTQDGNYINSNSGIANNEIIVGFNTAWHPNNFYHDDRTSGKFGKYVVRDLRELF